MSLRLWPSYSFDILIEVVLLFELSLKVVGTGVLNVFEGFERKGYLTFMGDVMECNDEGKF